MTPPRPGRRPSPGPNRRPSAPSPSSPRRSSTPRPSGASPDPSSRRPLRIPALLLLITALAALALPSIQGRFRLPALLPDFLEPRRITSSWSVLREIRGLQELETASYHMKVVFPFDFTRRDTVDWTYLKLQYDRDINLFMAKTDPAAHPGGRLPPEWEHAELYHICRAVGIDPGRPDYRFIVLSAVFTAGVDLEAWLAMFGDTPLSPDGFNTPISPIWGSIFRGTSPSPGKEPPGSGPFRAIFEPKRTNPAAPEDNRPGPGGAKAANPPAPEGKGAGSGDSQGPRGAKAANPPAPEGDKQGHGQGDSQGPRGAKDQSGVRGIRIKETEDGGKILEIIPPPVGLTSFFIEDKDASREGFPDIPLSPEEFRILSDALLPRLREIALSGGLIEKARTGALSFLTEIFTAAGYDSVEFSPS